MKTIIQRIGTNCHLILFVVLGILLFTSCDNDIADRLVNYPVASEPNATYYIDSEGGDDANAGTSEASAWKTFNNLNRMSLLSGNKILLKKGSVWQGQLAPKGSGTSANPIVLGSYGDGNRPIIDGQGEVLAAVYLSNQSNWVIQDLELKNFASERGDTYRCGILVENNEGGVISNIKIQNNYVHEVSGSFRYVGASHPHQYGGIAVNVIGQTATDKFDNVLIENNVVEKVGRTGIVVWDNYYASDAEASSNVIIRNNKVKDIDSDGILTFGCYGSLIEYNVAEACGSYIENGQFNGSAAIWCTRGRDCIIQYNEAFNTKALPGNDDGTGFDIDMDAVNCIVQYNYSHDNEGGFMLFVDASNSAGSIVRYNISQNDKTRIFMIAGGVTPNTQIYNNTIYLGEGSITKIIDHTWDDGGDINAAWFFKNNIIYNLGTGDYKIPGTGGVFAKNLYYGNHPVNEPFEVNKLTVNPLFINAGSGRFGIESLSGYKLEASSPIINEGVLVSKNGSKDFWGNIVSATGKATPGAYEPNGTIVGEIEILDRLENFDFISFKTDNWIQAWVGDPEVFGGDNTAIARGDDADGVIIYNFSDMKTFTITAYLYAGVNVEHLKMYGSSIGGDFANFSEIPVSYDDISTKDGWRKITVTPTALLPQGINYLGLRLVGGIGANWAAQLGEVLIIHKAQE